MIAEHAFNAQVTPDDGLSASSAGTEAEPMKMYTVVRDRLIERGADPLAHVQRRLTRDVLESADLPVAMSLDHQATIRKEFDLEIPLFNRVSHGCDEPLLDLGERLPHWRDDPAAADAYVREMVDTIWDAIPSFKQNVSGYWLR